MADSVHLLTFDDVPAEWRNEPLAEKWGKIFKVRRVVTGALEIERRDKRIGSSLEAAPIVHIEDDELRNAFKGESAADIFYKPAKEIEATIIHRLPHDEKIKDWINLKLITSDEAEQMFVRYVAAPERRRELQPTLFLIPSHPILNQGQYAPNIARAAAVCMPRSTTVRKSSTARILTASSAP